MSQCHEKVRSLRWFFFVNMFKMIILVYTTIYESVFSMFSSPCTAGTSALCHSRLYPSVRDYEFGYRPICSYVIVDTRKYCIRTCPIHITVQIFAGFIAFFGVYSIS